MRATRGPRPPRQTGPATRPGPAERWIDEGPIRDTPTWDDGGSLRGAAEEAAARAARRDRQTKAGTDAGEIDPTALEQIEAMAPSARAGRYRERLSSASEALGRGRFDDARRMVQPVLRDLPEVALAHEIAGQCFYATGQWRKAAAELELARQLDHSLRHHHLLADCYRAMRKYDAVHDLWNELKEASPEPALMAEGRIVAAGALADQGDIPGALRLMERARDVPKKAREYHLKQWYVLGDLYDRSGDVVQARRFFGLVATHDAEFADVRERLAGLGR